MRVLVTGGTGVIGTSAVTELLRRGHRVRLLSRRASRDVRQWKRVEPFDGDIRDYTTIRGAARGCDAVVHIAGIVTEQPPHRTFAAVNIGGTHNIIDEARASHVSRFVFVSSLGADTGRSDYHRSKLEAETIVKSSPLAWTIVRPGNVYGPADSVVSQMLKMMRSLPAVPIVEAGDAPFQPIWHKDLARAIAAVLDRNDLAGQTLEVAGNETTCINDLIQRLANLTDRKPVQIPAPNASPGLPSAINKPKLELVRETHVLRGANALEMLGVRPTPLDHALRELTDALPEQLPDDGVGPLEHKRFFAHITGSRLHAVSLMSAFRAAFARVIPLDLNAEPHATTRVEVGSALTMSLPMRGNVQVRVEVTEPTRVLLVTIDGHPIAGAIQFTTKDVAEGVEFAIDTYTRSANLFDLVAMKTLGSILQNANWKHVVQRVVDLAGGSANDGVQSSSEKLDEDAARQVEKKLRATVQARLREASGRDVENVPQR